MNTDHFDVWNFCDFDSQKEEGTTWWFKTSGFFGIRQPLKGMYKRTKNPPQEKELMGSLSVYVGIFEA